MFLFQFPAEENILSVNVSTAVLSKKILLTCQESHLTKNRKSVIPKKT